MSDDATEPRPYQVSYSGRVHRHLLALADAARERGDGEQFVAALKEFHRRLVVYPQFGDPLSDLRGQVGQVRLGVVPPLAMRYAVLEDQRSVLVGALPVLLAMSAGRADD